MNPYSSLPEKAFWKPAVGNRSLFDIEQLWDPKFHIRPYQTVSTFGSCFAQYIGRSLQARGYKWFITEPAPYGLSESNASTFNYNVFSSRTGNIYTTSLLKQWTEWALGKAPIPDEYWLEQGRYIDPFRPKIEPGGFESLEEMRRSLAHTVEAFGKCIKRSSYFVFTLGLTESWFNTETGVEYPMCPGTVGGQFDPSVHRFVNQDYQQILTSLVETMEMMREVSKDIKFILTVSPVPLTATCSGRHVAVATMASKSILRAVADKLATEHDHVDYFPSYEIINSPVFKGVFFQPNLRNVNPNGVSFVMNHFFRCLEGKYGTHAPARVVDINSAKSDENNHCEEELLEAFAK